MSDIVECHSDYAYAERPQALTWEGRRHEIVEIFSRWHSPEGPHFRVRVEDGQEFDLVYHEATDEWQIQQS